MYRLFILVLVLGACTKKEAPNSSSEAPASELFEQGKAIYMSNCIACHNPDPKKDGVLGPATHGSSLELIEGKVLRNEYPAGYKPKRDTRVMIPIPGLKDKIPALHEYLNK